MALRRRVNFSLSLGNVVAYLALNNDEFAMPAGAIELGSLPS